VTNTIEEVENPTAATLAVQPLPVSHGGKLPVGLKKAPKPVEAKPSVWEVVDRALVSKGGEFHLFGTKKRETPSANKTFICYHCGKLNSLPLVAPGTLFRCGVCRELFDTTNTTKYVPKPK
jgi:hypothetical protein